MSELKVFADAEPSKVLFASTDGEAITEKLNEKGVVFTRWKTGAQISGDSQDEEILKAYKDPIEQLMKERGYKSYDVINMTPDNPQKDALRQKFGAEHTHSEDEVRFFVRGKGLFTLHLESEVYEVTCEEDDLISVPMGTKHWFDMGDTPNFTCIRLFESTEGWAPEYTGSAIAESFSRLQ